MSKKPCFGTPCDSQHVKESEKVTKALPPYHFITLAKIELENVRPSLSEILGVFVNTLTANDKYYLHNRKNLRKPIQLQLPTKEKSFFNFLLHI